ncbi:MAG: nucleotide pyrophosphohydrolase [Desulfotalea sp.]|nr:MAG: nucleotide pyrophosphohydrolase [Desulfotalea sp.]
MTYTNQDLQQLLETIVKLRGHNGCPWDKKQTPLSLVKYLEAETVELVSAITNDDAENTCEELGDVLYILIMVSICNKERDAFGFSDVIQQVNEKLIRRHPHVFAGTTYKDEADLERQWREIKAREKQK